LNAREVPRIAAPLLLAAAIVVSFKLEQPEPPVELPGGAPTAPSAEATQAAYVRALAPGSPGIDRGAARAAVTVLEFSDFGCPYCARFAAETYPALATEFVATGRVRWVYMPFALGIFPNGDEAARAADCAGEQGPAAFRRMHDRLFADQESWKGSADAASAFHALASDAQLDMTRFAACYAGDAPSRRVHAADALADEMAVRATPTFFVNGRRIEGALPVEEFRTVLLTALQQTHTP